MKYLFFIISLCLSNNLWAAHAPAQAHFYFSYCSPLIPILIEQNAELKSDIQASLHLSSIQLALSIVSREELSENHNELKSKIKKQKGLITAQHEAISRLEKK